MLFKVDSKAARTAVSLRPSRKVLVDRICLRNIITVSPSKMALVSVHVLLFLVVLANIPLSFELQLE